MNIFVFDIETIPDLDAGRKLYDLQGLSDREVAEAMFTIRRQETGGSSDFIRHHLQKIVCISGVLRHKDQLKVWSLGEPSSNEAEIIERFFSGLEKITPVLVSWNGSGFDLPVLHYRALIHGVKAMRYWEYGEDDNSFKYNNYLNRYHYRHLDVMDVLSGFQSRAAASLDEIATLLGFPGKMGMDGSQVLNAVLDNQIEKVRDYCETDVLNTYLVYLRFELIRGRLSASEYANECQLVRSKLEQENKPHFQEFLAAWNVK